MQAFGGNANSVGWSRRSRIQRLRRQLYEAYQSAGVVAAFVAFSALLGIGQGSQGDLLRGRTDPPGVRADPGSREIALRSTPYRVEPTQHETPVLWLVDGFNVLNVAILRGTERDDFWGPVARERLLAIVRTLPEAGNVVVIFDGPDPNRVEGENSAGGAEEAARVVFAKNADEWLLRRLRDNSDPDRVAVVTADRKLAARARHRGAQIVSPGHFVAQCREHSEAG